MLQAPEPKSAREYKFLKFDTHQKAETALNEYAADGWQLVSYQAAGDSAAITHFLVLSRGEAASQPRSMGFR